MFKRIISVLTLTLFIVSSLVSSCNGFGLFPKPPGHNIIIAGVVKCMKNGVLTPEPGATVTIKTVNDAAELGDYELPKPQTVVTDANGMWGVTFDVPLDGVAMPGGFEAEVVTRCKKGKTDIQEDLVPVHDLLGIFDLMIKRAGNLYDLVKSIVTKLLKIRVPSAPASVKMIAYANFVETVVDCSDALPVPEPTPTPTEPEPPVAPELPPQVGPKEPTAERVSVTPKEPEATQTDAMPVTPREEPVDEYAKCIDKCKPILNKLEPLKKCLRELEESMSDKVNRLSQELDRLKKLRGLNEKNFQQQKYVTPDSKEHWGLTKFEKQYGDNGYTPVPGTQRTSLAAARFIEMLKKKISDAEAGLDKAMKEDEKAKDAERKNTEDQMARIQKEYENCIRGCDIYKDDTRAISQNADFIVKTKVDLVRSPAKDAVRSIFTDPIHRPGLDAMPRHEPVTDTTHGADVMPQPTKTDAAPSPPPDVSGGAMPISDPVHLPVDPTKPLEKAYPRDQDGAMPIGSEEHLTDPSAGFDKTHPTDTNRYERGDVPIEEEEVQYKQISQDRTKCDTATLYKSTPGGMDVTTATVVTGKGSDFRKWKVDHVGMNIDGEPVQPEREEEFYIEKDSYFRDAAVVTFTAIGSQYSRYAGESQSGEVCPVTGQKKESVSRRSSMSEGIDRAGMAAGIGLLASQARGSIPAKKAVFKLNKEQTKKILDKKGQLRVKASNETAHQEETFKVPMR